MSLGDGFFRVQSRPARDISVLLARSLARRPSGNDGQRWLDLMSGCGIRALRWGLEALPEDGSGLELWVNDADPDRLPLLESNLAVLQSRVAALRLSAMPAEVLLARAFVEKRFFDLIDLDAFGHPGALIQPALQALGTDGILVLASTDGRSPTGHDRPGAIRSFGAAARVHPASWELALRQQLGLLARQAWLLGRGIQPLLSFSDGRTFRLAIRLTRQLQFGEESQLGLLARCGTCGAQQSQPLLQLRNWPACHCPAEQGRWAISGPLWLGPLQQVDLLEALMASPVPLAPATRRLLQRLQADPGGLGCVWSTAELARRCGSGPPPLRRLVAALRAEGYKAWPSGVMAGQVRTDADLPELLQVCSTLRLEGPLMDLSTT